jgi:ribosomal protein S18 acetylase RimI-like enzyme
MLVTEQCRGLGIGKQLIDRFKAYCKQNNINNLKVEASAKNLNAISFYKRNGFEDFNVTLTTKI